MTDETNFTPPEPKPAPDYQPLPTAQDLNPEPKKKTYDGNDTSSLREAASDLQDARAANKVPKAEDEPIDRGYRWQSGLGDPVESEYTIETRRAAEDLTRARQNDAAAANPTDTDRIAQAVDAMRAAYPGRELPPTFVQDLQVHAQQAAEAQQTEQPGHQPQVDQQPVGPPLDERARLEQAWQNTPAEVQAAIQQELQQTEQARAAYAQQALAAARVAGAALFANFPELASLSAQELPHAISAIAKVNPEKAMAIQAQVQRTQQLWQASQQAEAQRAAIQSQQLQQWAAQQDAVFEREVASKESPETMRKLAETVVGMAEEYGVSKDELAAAWQSQPVMRSAAFQRMMVDAAKYRMATREVVNKIDRSAPPVQRPGVSQPRVDDSGVAAAMKAFRSDPSPKSAAALLIARRAANSRR
jgi:hypothetical protein